MSDSIKVQRSYVASTAWVQRCASKLYQQGFLLDLYLAGKSIPHHFADCVVEDVVFSALDKIFAALQVASVCCYGRTAEAHQWLTTWRQSAGLRDDRQIAPPETFQHNAKLCIGEDQARSRW